MNRLPKTTFLLAYLAWGIFAGKLYASHSMGSFIQYSCVNACTIRVELVNHAGCGSIINVNPNTLAFQGDSSSCTLPTPIGNWVQGPLDPLTFYCNPSTGCNSSTYGKARMVYTRDYDVCGLNCSNFTVSWTDCCRMQSITTGGPSATIQIGNFGTTLNLGLGMCNNSPRFSRSVVQYIPVNGTTTLALGAQDPDGDSLAYELVAYQHSNGSPASYGAGYSPQQPLGTMWLHDFDSLSGNLTLTPNFGSYEVAPIGLICYEYRNGVQIGAYRREITIFSVAFPGQAPVLTLENPQNCEIEDYAVKVCPGKPFSFSLHGSDPDGAVATTLVGEHSLSGATLLDSVSGLPFDSLTAPLPVAQFSWTAPMTPGYYPLVIYLNEDSCDYGLTASYQIRIHVVKDALPVAATATVSNCSDVAFSAGASSAFAPLVYTWAGSGGFASTAPNPSFSYPGAGTYPYSVMITDSTGCYGSFLDSITLSMPTATYSAFPDSCLRGNFSALGAGGTPPFTYNWQFSTGDSATGANVLLNFPNPGTYGYSVTITDAAGCQIIFSNNLIFTSPPTPTIYFANDTLFAPPGSNYQWNFNGAPISGANLPWYVPTAEGDYSVTLLDSSGCLVESHVFPYQAPLSLENEIWGEWKVYPVPAQSELFIRLEIPATIETLEIFGMDGRRIQKRDVKGIMDFARLDLSGLNAGIYFLKIRGLDRVEVVKFLVE